MRLKDKIRNFVLNPILNRIFPEKEEVILPATTQIMAQRFRDLFMGHGVEVTQIPRLYDKITLNDLASDENLIKMLTPEMIDEVAALFAVRPEWLEGKDNQIYTPYGCYKDPKRFFELINRINYSYLHIPARAITSSDDLDFRDRASQPIVMIVVDEIAVLGDEIINRYYICDGEWDWAHSPCRYQLKAQARLLYENLRVNTPLKQVDYSVLDEIGRGYKIPKAYIELGLCTNPSLEDYALSSEESRLAKETDELPNILEYIHEEGLGDIAFATNKNLKELSKPKSDAHAKAATAKHQPVYQLKRECVLYWLNNQKLSNDEAARRFYRDLSKERQKLLTETNAEKTLSKAISEYRNRDKPKNKDKLSPWLIGFNPKDTI